MDEIALRLGRVIIVMSGCVGIAILGLILAWLVSFINPTKGWRWRVGAQLASLNLSPAEVKELYYKIVIKYNLTEEEQDMMFMVMRDVIKEHNHEISREKFNDGVS